MKMNKQPKMKFSERVYRFMQGRNGPDDLYHLLSAAAIILMLVNLFVNSFIITLLYVSLFAYSLFRVFSRNVYKRRAENAKYVSARTRFFDFWKLLANMWRDRKTHIYKKCPHCKKTLRLPKRKGEHTVKCPCCQNRFDIKVK